MKIISSQKYLDQEIIEAKLSELAGETSVELVAWDVKAYDCAILSDGHHTYAAAQELGIPVKFIITAHPEGISGDNLLEQAWMDSDWYDLETGQAAF
jgi:hypothetical protein